MPVARIVFQWRKSQRFYTTKTSVKIRTHLSNQSCTSTSRRVSRVVFFVLLSTLTGAPLQHVSCLYLLCCLGRVSLCPITITSPVHVWSSSIYPGRFPSPNYDDIIHVVIVSYMMRLEKSEEGDKSPVPFAVVTTPYHTRANNVTSDDSHDSRHSCTSMSASTGLRKQQAHSEEGHLLIH